MKVLMILVLATIAISAGAWTSCRDERDSQGRRPTMIRLVLYWTITFAVAFELVAGGVWDLLRIEYVRSVLIHLGYPVYLGTILGIWRGPGGAAMLLPAFPKLKEWAYAGAVFNYTGAAASHILVGDQVSMWIAPLIFAGLTLFSWFLRPPTRLHPSSASVKKIATVDWLVSVSIVAAMLVAAFFTVPIGATSR